MGPADTHRAAAASASTAEAVPEAGILSTMKEREKQTKEALQRVGKAQDQRNQKMETGNMGSRSTYQPMHCHDADPS